jgi:flagellum-specific ATP synthase
MKVLAEQINELDGIEIYGRVVGVRGLMVEVAGPLHAMSVGARVVIETPGKSIPSEVVGFSGVNTLLMPFAPLEGVRRGCRALVTSVAGAVRPSLGWLGRVVNALGSRSTARARCSSDRRPIRSATRRRWRMPGAASARRSAGAEYLRDPLPRPTHGHILGFGRRQIGSAIDAGAQRLGRRHRDRAHRRTRPRGAGIPPGRSRRSGARALGGSGLDLRRAGIDAPPGCSCDVRHRRIFLRRRPGCPGADGFGHALRHGAARDRALRGRAGDGQNTPTVFTELPRLLERAGPGTDQGTITGIFTVLVDGDDYNEPIADAVRGILDGHIVMERTIAERGRYPAINVLKSVSRTMPRAADQAYLPALTRARQVMATYTDMEELIRLGAYRAGSSPDVDEAIRLHKPLEDFLAQGKEEATSLAEGYRRLAEIVTVSETER